MGTLGMVLGQLGPFFGIFFGTKGPDGEWPHAWWSFCFFGSAFGVLGWYPQSLTYKIVRTPSELIFKNLYGGKIQSIPSESIESIEEKKGWCGKYIEVMKTEGFFNMEKAKAKCCKCCVCKTVTFCLGSTEYANFLRDTGMAENKASP